MLLQPCKYYQSNSLLSPTADKVIGHLNRKYGFNHYTPNEIGAEVYEDARGYYLLHSPIGKDQNVPVYFYKDSAFKTHINFIKNERN